jgi:asparagine synthase (glutamine-hydrolysing)
LLGEQLVDAAISTRGGERSVERARRILTEYLAHDLQGQFVSEYLTKVDGGTMYFGLEARSPFLDQELWSFAGRLPVEMRMRGWRLKPLLRDIASRRISARVAHGRKSGFAVPVRSWLGGTWRTFAIDRLRDSFVQTQGWLNVRPLLDELSALRPGQPGSQQLWYALVLEEWLRTEQRVGPEHAGALHAIAVEGDISLLPNEVL